MAQETTIVDASFEWSEKARVAGSAERDALLVAHAPLVKYVAQRIASRLANTVELDDLVSDGMVGLLEATERFDAKRGVLFKTFAENRIRGAILDGVRNRDWAPRSLRRASRTLEEAMATVEGRTGRAATEAEIAEELGLEDAEFQQLVMKARGVRLQEMGAQEDFEVADAAPSVDPHAHVLQAEKKSLLAEHIAELPERERLVLSLYYEREMSLREIGEVLGVTESRICQIQTRAISRLRVWIAKASSLPELAS